MSLSFKPALPPSQMKISFGPRPRSFELSTPRQVLKEFAGD